MIEIDWLEGNCPVQAEGRFDGVPFYFRARGKHWSVEVGPGAPKFDGRNFSYRERYGDDAFAAGWMDKLEARMFIDKAYHLWKESFSESKHRTSSPESLSITASSRTLLQ